MKSRNNMKMQKYFILVKKKSLKINVLKIKNIKLEIIVIIYVNTEMLSITCII